MLRTKIGVVIHKKTDKTALIRLKTVFFHSKLKVIFFRSKNYLMHDEKNICKEGMIILTKFGTRCSKRKTWYLDKILC